MVKIWIRSPLELMCKGKCILRFESGFTWKDYFYDASYSVFLVGGGGWNLSI